MRSCGLDVLIEFKFVSLKEAKLNGKTLETMGREVGAVLARYLRQGFPEAVAMDSKNNGDENDCLLRSTQPSGRRSDKRLYMRGIMDTFFAQSGYAFYVWSAYGMALILLVLELVQLDRWRRAVLARLAHVLRARASRGISVAPE